MNQSRVFTHSSHDPIIDIIQGNRHNLKSLETEGVSTTLATNIEKCFWNEDRPFSYLTNSNSGTSFKIKSSNVADSQSGDGARTILIEGLLHSVVNSVNTYTVKTETINLNGTTDVNVGTFYRILKISVASAGVLKLNQGQIKVYVPSGNLVFACMAAGDNVSNMMVVSPETDKHLIVESLSLSSYAQTPIQIKVNIFSETTGLQKTIYKFFAGGQSQYVNFSLRKRILPGETLWMSLLPLETVTGSHNYVTGLLECIKKNQSSVVPVQ